jgi:hypothetical protein
LRDAEPCAILSLLCYAPQNIGTQRAVVEFNLDASEAGVACFTV